MQPEVTAEAASHTCLLARVHASGPSVLIRRVRGHEYCCLLLDSKQAFQWKPRGRVSPGFADDTRAVGGLAGGWWAGVQPEQQTVLLGSQVGSYLHFRQVRIRLLLLMRRYYSAASDGASSH